MLRKILGNWGSDKKMGFFTKKNISTPAEIAVGTPFYTQYGTKSILVFLTSDGAASWLLLPSLISLLSSGSVQPECYRKILLPDRNKDATDPRNWVHGKNQNWWNADRCNSGYTNHSKKANKKANWLPIKWRVYCMTKKNFYKYTKNYCESSEQWKESGGQEANKKANWLPIKRAVYCMTTQKFYQYTKDLLKQWKESGE